MAEFQFGTRAEPWAPMSSDLHLNGAVHWRLASELRGFLGGFGASLPGSLEAPQPAVVLGAQPGACLKSRKMRNGDLQLWYHRNAASSCVNICVLGLFPAAGVEQNGPYVEQVCCTSWWSHFYDKACFVQSYGPGFVDLACA